MQYPTHINFNRIHIEKNVKMKYRIKIIICKMVILMIWIYYAWKYAWSLLGHLCSWEIHTTKFLLLLLCPVNFRNRKKKVFYVCKRYKEMLNEIQGIFSNPRVKKYVEVACLDCLLQLFVLYICKIRLVVKIMISNAQWHEYHCEKTKTCQSQNNSSDKSNVEIFIWKNNN